MTKDHGKAKQSATGERFLRTGVWVFLTVVVLAVSVARDSDAAFPMFGWLMYAHPQPHPSSIQTVRVDVSTVGGEVVSFFPPDLLTHVESTMSERIMRRTFEKGKRGAANRQFLVRALAKKLAGVNVRSIAGWELEWDVAEGRPRRISRDDPDRSTLLGTFPTDVSQ